jgi:heme-degrading monooxygenase HmoA
MFIRMAKFRLKAEQREAAVRAYHQLGLPKVKASPGNVAGYLLEPVEGDEHVAITIWNSEADAKAYEASGTAAEVAGTIRAAFAGPPELQSYRAS